MADSEEDGLRNADRGWPELERTPAIDAALRDIARAAGDRYEAVLDTVVADLELAAGRVIAARAEV